MSGRCMCGDPECPSCGAAQGTLGWDNHGDEPVTVRSAFRYRGWWVMFNEPTADQCAANTILAEDPETGRVAFAAWHPQWGGYVGKSVVETTRGPEGCFEVHNWHDGEFVRSDYVTSYHYCCADQLVEFGGLVNRMQGEEGR